MFSPTKLPAQSSLPSVLPQASRWRTEMEHLISRRDEKAIHTLLASPAMETEALPALLAHACQSFSPLSIKQALTGHPGFDPNAPGSEGKRAIDLAIQYDDMAFAGHLLKNGADPELARQPPSQFMREMLDFFRRKNKLYPPGMRAETEFDRALQEALQEGRHNDAWTLLNREQEGDSPAKAWLNAVKDKRRDILRAMLLLESAGTLKALAGPQHGAPLQEALALKDKGLNDVIKEYPYFSPKRGEPKWLNGQAKFSGTGEAIECRHLVAYQQEVQAVDDAIKFDHDDLKDAATIATHVKPDVQAKYEKLKAQAAETHLFPNEKFGQFMAGQFEAMERQGPATRLVLVQSTSHSMNLGLRIKHKGGRKFYVAKFFDPNRTTSSTHNRASSLKTFETQELRAYIDENLPLQRYYGKEEFISMAFVRPNAKVTGNEEAVPQSAHAGRRLTSNQCAITPAVVWHLLSNGFAGELRQLKEEINKLPLKERIELLAAKDFRGVPGLYKALQAGHAEVIKVYGELLQDLPPKERLALLDIKNLEGVPGLHMALCKGHAEAIEAYGELLQDIPPEERVALVVAKDREGTSGLYMALQEGHAKAVKAYGKLLQGLSPDALPALLAAKDRNGLSSLFWALQKHPETVSQYIEMVEQIAPVLSQEGRAALWKDIMASHSRWNMGMWINYGFYDHFKATHGELYARFEEMKNMLKT